MQSAIESLGVRAKTQLSGPSVQDPTHYPEAMAITRCLVPSEKLSSFFVIKLPCIYYLLDIVLLQVSIWGKKGLSDFNFFLRIHLK